MIDLLIVCLYLNDLLVTGSKGRNDAFKHDMKAKFEMNGKISYFLEI